MAAVTMRTLFLSLLLSMPAQAWSAELAAKLDWSKRVELSPLVSGVVKAVNVEPGQHVDQGALLLQFDDRLFKARNAEAEAALEHARLLFQEAEREQQRADELYDRTVLSNHEYEQSKVNFAAASLAMRSAELRLVETTLDLERSAISAPFDAWVVERLVEPGASIVSELQTAPLLVVTYAGRMRAVTKIESSLARKIEIGSSATVVVGKQRYRARVASIGAVEGGHQLDVAFSHSNDHLYLGQKAKIILP
ncbi:hypothetical protein BOW53_03915 [Solemya pervernicosa gill symbiont]|uniref:Multidrug resistance protein MdtA-like barrel-sandwich hybrid domain-containing protein n=3 Tax=Gammaproteobacteria incertae sedis TaxID=118884 RepID=A0A1T2L8P3_9GAMM|nr:hypothetical protein BOW53_03915 [Solemya pervernicosa gill symbiont]